MVAGYSRVWSSVSNCFLYRLNEVRTANLRLQHACYLHWGHNHMAEIKLQKAPGSLPNTPQAGLAFGREDLPWSCLNLPSSWL